MPAVCFFEIKIDLELQIILVVIMTISDEEGERLPHELLRVDGDAIKPVEIEKFLVLGN